MIITEEMFVISDTHFGDLDSVANGFDKLLDQIILNRLDEIYTEFPYYGYRRMYHTLIQEGKI